mmetsp:Transcript_18166/g.41393  ORF Transcript_18166/g.41393 Transcript_18166/m.41393 type:complete len:355 (-) Transcript_18166:109-1173(-)
MKMKSLVLMIFGFVSACLFAIVECNQISEKRLRANLYVPPKSQSIFIGQQRYLPSEFDSDDYDDHFYSLSYSYSYSYISNPSIIKELPKTLHDTKTKSPTTKDNKDTTETPTLSPQTPSADSPVAPFVTDSPTDSPVHLKVANIPFAKKISCDPKSVNVGSVGVKEMPISFYYDVQTIDKSMDWIDSLQNRILQTLADDVLKCEEGVVQLDNSGNRRFLQSDSNIFSIGSMPNDEPTGDECDATNASARFCTRMMGHITVTYIGEGNGETIKENILALIQDDMATSKYTSDEIPEIVQIDFVDTTTKSVKLQRNNSSNTLAFSFVGAGITLVALFLVRSRNKSRGNYEEDFEII